MLHKFDLGELALYMFHMDFQIFVRDIFMTRFAETHHMHT